MKLLTWILIFILIMAMIVIAPKKTAQIAKHAVTYAKTITPPTIQLIKNIAKTLTAPTNTTQPPGG